LAEFTENYSLEKPAQTDYYDVAVFNENADKIDNAMKANADAIAEAVKDAEGKADKRKKLTFVSGDTIALADGTEYRGTAITEFTMVAPDGDYECWIAFTTAESGALKLTFPEDTVFCGTVPSLENDTYYEISIKDNAVVMATGVSGETILTGGV